LNHEIEEALNKGDTEKARFLIESYRNKFGENAEYISMQAVFYEYIGDYVTAGV
jgi:hypothetical protein